MKQKALAGATLAALITLVGTWEGLRTEAYRDIIGVLTVCYGETKGVKQGDKYTPEQCKTKLAKEVVEYDARLQKCMTRQLSNGERIALVSLSYNAGTSAVCKSTALKLMNQGKRKEGCDALLKWSYAGGQFVQGLRNRREAERKICLSA
jgi:GH24 family phage-related lysozyme (muramidase)